MTPTLHPRTPAPAWTSMGEWLAALSLANLLYLRTWDGLLDSGANITPTAYLVAVANVLLLATLLWGGYRVGAAVGGRAGRWGLALAAAGLALIPFHAISSIFFSENVTSRTSVYAIGLLAALLLLWSRRARVASAHTLRVLAPLVAVTFGQAIWRAATYDGSRWERPTAPRTAQADARPRVIWIIFDEWDYGLTFDPSPEWLRTPELDRLRAISLHASQAVAPGAETDVSIPRLLTGDMEATRRQLPQVPSIFTRARANGRSTAVSAWYIDYCGTFASTLTACWSTEGDPVRNSMGAAPAEIAMNQLRYLFESTYRSPFGQSFGTKRHILDYGFVMRGALEAAASPGLDLVFLHFPIPHPPFFYDRTTKAYDLGDTPLVGSMQVEAVRYFDALELVDRTLGQVRRALESANVWDRTHLIVSSDHAARNRERIRPGTDRRVPFIVRVAGAADEVPYDRPFNTVVSADLAMAMLEGEIRTVAQVRRFLEEHASDGVTPSPAGAPVAVLPVPSERERHAAR